MKYGANDLKIEFDDDAGTLVDITSHVTGINGINVEGLTEEGTVFGDEWVIHWFSGVRQAGEITVDGFYDDAADGPDDLFNAVGDTRTLKLTYGGTKTASVETIIRSYAVNPVRKESTKYQARLLPTGTVTQT